MMCVCPIDNNHYITLHYITFLFMYEISRDSGTAERICAKYATRVLVPRSTSLNVKVSGQGHQGQKTSCALPSPPAAMEWSVLLHDAL